LRRTRRENSRQGTRSRWSPSKNKKGELGGGFYVQINIVEEHKKPKIGSSRVHQMALISPLLFMHIHIKRL